MKTIQVEYNKSSKQYFIYIDDKKVDGPLSQIEVTKEMKQYENTANYKVLPPKIVEGLMTFKQFINE